MSDGATEMMVEEKRGQCPPYQREELSPLKVQIGGNHYSSMAIQPVEFIERNGLSFLQGCIIKRICRYKSKDGLQDLMKARHEIDLLIELGKK